MDNQELPVDYGKNDGISFALVHTGTFDDYPNRPRLEAVGNDKVHTAFGGSCTGMNDRDHLGTLGDVFLRFPRQDLEGQYDGLPALLVTYEGETEEASGMLYDIDGRTKATEHFKVSLSLSLPPLLPPPLSLSLHCLSPSLCLSISLSPLLPLVTWHQSKNPQDGSCGTACPHALPGNGL